MELHIELTKVSPTHHTLGYIREDRTGETVELETRSFLVHDLIHFVVETEAGLKDSFYGLLCQGAQYSQLSENGIQDTDDIEVRHTERVVGMLDGVVKNNVTSSQFMAGLRNVYDASGEKVPHWVFEEFVEKIAKRMTALLGEWRGTPFGQPMKLVFSV